MALLPTLVADHALGSTQNHGRRLLVPQIIVLGGLIPINVGIIITPTCTPLCISAGTPIVPPLVTLMAPTVVTMVALIFLLMVVISVTTTIIVTPTWLLGREVTCCHEGLVRPLSQTDHVFKGIWHLQHDL